MQKTVCGAFVYTILAQNGSKCVENAPNRLFLSFIWYLTHVTLYTNVFKVYVKVFVAYWEYFSEGISWSSFFNIAEKCQTAICTI